MNLTRRSKAGSQDDRVEIPLASMIDVTFLLLIYFMLTYASAMKEDHLDPSIQTAPDSTSGGAGDFVPQRVVVSLVGGRPAWQVGATAADTRAELAGLLRQLRTDEPLTIEVHNGIHAEHAVAALQVAHDAGFRKVTYVAAK